LQNFVATSPRESLANCLFFRSFQSDNDRQVLEFDRDHIEVVTKNGRVAHTIIQRKAAPRLSKKKLKRNRPVN
jgi:hypothetical protein